jgi:hypothetical protein
MESGTSERTSMPGGACRVTVDPTRIAEVDAQQAHIDAALDAVERVGGEREWIGIADRLASHLKHRAIYFEQLDPPDSAQIAASLLNLATVLQVLGKGVEARPLLERALAIKQKIYGAEHRVVASSLPHSALML